MRGDDLLLAHLAILLGPDDLGQEERASARERLADEVGRELAEHLIAQLGGRYSPGRSRGPSAGVPAFGTPARAVRTLANE